MLVNVNIFFKYMMSRHPFILFIICCIIVNSIISIIFASNILNSFDPNNSIKTQPPPHPLFSLTSPVIDLHFGQSDPLEKILKEDEQVFVMFYAPWDLDSKAAVSEFEKAAEFLEDVIKFVAVNCWYPLGVCRNTNKLMQYPVFYYYIIGFEGINYRGPFRADYFVRFIDRVMSPLTFINSPGQLPLFLSSQDNVVAGFFDFASTINPLGFITFYHSALLLIENDFLNAPFYGVINLPSIASTISLTMPSSLALIRIYNSTLKLEHINDYSSIQISKWVLANSQEPFFKNVHLIGQKSLVLSNLLSKGKSLFFLHETKALSPTKSHIYTMISDLALLYNDCAQLKFASDSLKSAILQRYVVHRNIHTLEENCAPAKQWYAQAGCTNYTRYARNVKLRATRTSCCVCTHAEGRDVCVELEVPFFDPTPVQQLQSYVAACAMADSFAAKAYSSRKKMALRRDFMEERVLEMRRLERFDSSMREMCVKVSGLNMGAVEFIDFIRGEASLERGSFCAHERKVDCLNRHKTTKNRDVYGENPQSDLYVCYEQMVSYHPLYSIVTRCHGNSTTRMPFLLPGNASSLVTEWMVKRRESVLGWVGEITNWDDKFNNPIKLQKMCSVYSRASALDWFHKNSPINMNSNLIAMRAAKCQSNVSISNFYSADISVFEDLLNSLGLKLTSVPYILLLNLKNEFVYGVQAPENENDLIKLVNDFENDSLVKHKRSFDNTMFLESVNRAREEQRFRPELSTSETNRLTEVVSVKELDALTFEENIYGKKDVVLFLYSRQCAFCYQASRLFLLTSQYLKPVESLLFARIDSNANDLPFEFQPISLPSIIFVPASRKADSTVFSAISSHISLRSLVTFISENASPVVLLEMFVSTLSTDETVCRRSQLEGVREIILLLWRKRKAVRELLVDTALRIAANNNYANTATVEEIVSMDVPQAFASFNSLNDGEEKEREDHILRRSVLGLRKRLWGLNVKMILAGKLKYLTCRRSVFRDWQLSRLKRWISRYGR